MSEFDIKRDAVPIPPDGCKFRVGDAVTFTNEYGLKFPGHKVTGFAKPEDYCHGRFIYVDDDSPWFPVRPEMLAPE